MKVLCYTERTSYIEQASAITLLRAGVGIGGGCWGTLPPLVLPLPLRIGDHLRLVPESQLGHPAHYGDEGELITTAQIPITLEAVFTAAQPGEPIWFDDGKIGGQIVSNDGNTIDGVITQTRRGVVSCRPKKGSTCQRMSSHQDKKRSMLRKLSVSQV